MFNKARITIKQCNPRDFQQYKEAGGKSDHWRLDLQIFFNNHGDNVADYVLYHHSLPKGYRQVYDNLFTNGEDLARCVDKLFNNWRNESLIYGNHEKEFLHREIQSFILDSFKDVQVEYFNAKEKRPLTKKEAQRKAKK